MTERIIISAQKEISHFFSFRASLLPPPRTTTIFAAQFDALSLLTLVSAPLA
jgi:hypothetical protein